MTRVSKTLSDGLHAKKIGGAQSLSFHTQLDASACGEFVVLSNMAAIVRPRISRDLICMHASDKNLLYLHGGHHFSASPLQCYRGHRNPSEEIFLGAKAPAKAPEPISPRCGESDCGRLASFHRSISLPEVAGSPNCPTLSKDKIWL